MGILLSFWLLSVLPWQINPILYVPVWAVSLYHAATWQRPYWVVAMALFSPAVLVYWTTVGLGIYREHPGGQRDKSN